MIPRRTLGRQGLEVSALGLGCMGMSFAYGTPATEADAMRVLDRALELGIDFWDTAQLYGPGFANEILLGKAMKGRRDKVVLATKFAYAFDDMGNRTRPDSSPKNVRKTVEESLLRLQTDHIDLLYQHRLDPNTPIEDTMGEVKRLHEEGKVLYAGLSEVGPKILRRASAVFPISALQSEYSLFETSVEERILPACRELGIGFVAYSPLGRGFLSGTLRSRADLESGDWRLAVPRFSEENFPLNLKLVDGVTELAARRGSTPGQVALAWLLAQGPDIVPIPGTKRISFLEENARAAEMPLSSSELAELAGLLAAIPVLGTRYPEAMMTMLALD